MLVVPALAMFSHKVPAAARRQLRQGLWEPLVAALSDAVGLGGGADAAPRRSAQDGPALAAANVPAPATPTVTSTEVPAAAAIEPIFATPHPASAPSAAHPPPLPSPGMPTLATGAVRDAPPVAADAPGADRAALEARLRACGATEVEWGPAGEGDGLQRCSCRIPAEPTGQLHRVFQASGPDALAALQALVDQVTAWSSRHGTATAPGTAAGRSR